MERRREARVPAAQPMQLTLLGGAPRSVAGVVVNFSSWGMRILLPEPVASGAPVRVDLDGSLYLGEVCYCQPELGQYSVGVAVEQALRMTSELAELRDAILCGR
jgi:hypothetical protein